MTKKLPNCVGVVYGNLQIVEDLGHHFCGNSPNRTVLVMAKCLRCGSGPKRYRLSSLKVGATASCGCATRDAITTHGMSGTRQYYIWSAMVQRCTNPKHPKWSDYGGRGIRVCNEWLKFSGFWKDMAEGYSDDLEIDRVDVNGNYEKQNCRWATQSQNSFNTRLGKNNTSGRSGISFAKDRGMWRATIRINGKQIRLGAYRTVEEAIAARDSAEIEQYGQTKN